MTDSFQMAGPGQAASLVRPTDDNGKFGRRDREALQVSPDAVLARAALSEPLPRPRASPMSESEIDEALEDSFPASDPPSWTLGTNHTPPEQEA